jgi:hypothetical protein
MHFISSNSTVSSNRTGHLRAPPLGLAAGDAPRVKTRRGWYHLARLDPLNLFPTIKSSNLHQINGLQFDL